MGRSFGRKVAKVLFSKRYLLATNTLLSGGLMGMGDFIQQNIEKTQQKQTTVGLRWTARHTYDWERTGRMTTLGLFSGPIAHGWYSFLDKILVGTSRPIIIRKIVADQLIESPTQIALFFIGMGILEKRTYKDYMAELREKFMITYMFDFVFWVPIQGVNFVFISPTFRVLYFNCAVVIYNVFLSYIKFNDEYSGDSAREMIL